MTLKKFLYSIKGTDQRIRIFNGCRTLFYGDITKITRAEWSRVRPYINYELSNKQTINDVIVVAL